MFIKINTDGSSLGNPGQAGFGGLLCDENGKWVVGYSGYIPWADNLCVELLAMRKGLDLAWRLGLRKSFVSVIALKL